MESLNPVPSPVEPKIIVDQQKESSLKLKFPFLDSTASHLICLLIASLFLGMIFLYFLSVGGPILSDYICDRDLSLGCGLQVAVIAMSIVIPLSTLLTGFLLYIFRVPSSFSTTVTVMISFLLSSRSIGEVGEYIPLSQSLIGLIYLYIFYLISYFLFKWANSSLMKFFASIAVIGFAFSLIVLFQ